MKGQASSRVGSEWFGLIDQSVTCAAPPHPRAQEEHARPLAEKDPS